VEATKKTSVTRAALLVLAALSMLLSGLFIATASRSDATPPPACPAGFNLTADAKNCFQAATVTTADNANSCPAGQLTPDGTTCYVAARIIPQEGTTLCPKGYSPDDSLQKMCARFEPATLKAPTCPEGASGVAGACYILVAKGPGGSATCTLGTLAGTATTPSNTCVVVGDAPVNAPGICPESATVIKDLDGSCYALVSRNPVGTCAAGYVPFTVAPDTNCKAVNPNQTSVTLAPLFVCPAAPVAVNAPTHTTLGVTKITFCEYMLPITGGDCPTGSTDAGGDPNTGDCRRPVDLSSTGKICPQADYSFVGGKCIRYVYADVAAASCPSGSIPVEVSGTTLKAVECRKPVADATGQYYCKDANAALNGKSCVWITGFLIDPAPTLYKCDTGVRTVIGSGASTQVLCLLGAANANTTTGPSCLQGVLSTDNLYCIVPRIDTAPATSAPVPSFTG
jgi:hypothetical protein